MKQFYLVLFCLITNNTLIQSQRDNTYPQIQAAWDFTYNTCGGDNWNVKTIDQLEARSESPYIKFSTSQAYSGAKAYDIFEIIDLSNNNLQGDLPQQFTKNEDFSRKAVWEYGSEKILLSHNKLTSVPNGMGIRRNGYFHTVKMDNNKLTSFHTDNSEDFIGANISLYKGCKVITLHQNEITSLKGSNFGPYFNGLTSIIDNMAEEVRIDNNRLNFMSLCEVVPFIKEQYGYRSADDEGNPNCNFDYYPQKPLGNDVSEVNADKETEQNLNFSLTHPKNVYTWVLNGKEVPLSDGKDFNFTLTEETAGIYTCKITNSELPEVSLYSKDMPVFMNKAGNKVIADFQILHDPITSNFPENAIVADFQGEDPDDDIVYYRLIEGAVNNSSFRIHQGKTLISAEPLFDRTYLSEYKILVEAYDIYGGKKQKEFTITKGAGGGTALPQNITLSSLSINENQVDAIIGTLTAVGVDGYSFSLINESDKNFFYIEGQSLKTKVGLDFETQKNFSIRIKASAVDGTQMKKDFTITVNDLNDAPYSIFLTADIALIKVNSGAFIGQLVGADQDPTDIDFTYELKAGDGDVNNNDFTIQGNRLLSTRRFTESDLGQKSIRIEVKDDEGAALEQILEITIQGEITENKMPRGLGLSNNVIWKEFKVNDIISYIFMSDPEGVSGTFTSNSEYIEINGNIIRLTKLPNSEEIIEVEITGNDGDNDIKTTFRFYREGGTTGIKSIQQSNIRVYPNPAIENLNFSELIDGEIYSLSGKLIRSFAQKNQVFVGDLNQGMYLLKIKIGDSIFSSKFIKK